MNGLSDIYNHCKDMGDFIWIDTSKVKEFTFPFSKGTAYVSCVSAYELNQIYIWATIYPDIKFIIGGTAAYIYYDSDVHFPSNFILIKQTAEEYFNVPNFSCKWALDIQNINNKNSFDQLFFSYAINSTCYWNKCIFCSHGRNVIRKRKELVELDFFDSIDFKGIKNIQFHCPAPDVKLFRNYVSQFKYAPDIIYNMHLRCDDFLNPVVDDVFSNFKDQMPQFKFKIGVEFPTQRMLNYMKKGTNIETIIKTIKLLQKYPSIKVYLMFIVGWPNLIKEDIDNLKRFRDEIGIASVHYSIVSKFRCLIDAPAYEMYKNQIDEKEVDEKESHGPFYLGYYPKMSDEAKKLNEEAELIIGDIGVFYSGSYENSMRLRQ